MRNISFSATTEQVRRHLKHVTRRGNKKGPTWKNLQAGEHLMGCEKCQGLGRGGKIVRIEEIFTYGVGSEPLNDIIERPVRHLPLCIVDQYPEKYRMWLNPGWGIAEVVLEGFPELTPEQFVKMFCEMNNCEPETEITRILFDYVGGKP
jgi:hypothetical protein